MRIAHILLSLNPDYGGPATSAPSLAAAQSMSGHDVTLVVPATPGVENDIATAILQCPPLAKVRITTVRFSVVEQLRTLLPMPSPDIGELVDFDFLHIHDLWQPFLMCAASTAIRHRIPYALSPRGTLNSWSLAQKNLKKRISLLLFWRDLLKRAAFIHALNDTEAREILRSSPNSNIVILPNGALLTPLEEMPRPNTFRKKYTLSTERRFILFLGRLHTNKGLDLLVDAFSQLSEAFPDVDLVIAGPDEGAEPAARRQVKALNLGNRIFLVGPVYGADKVAAFVDASVFCLPSRGEAFSMAIVEAMASGVPVVISEQCNFPEAADANAAIVCPLKPTDIAHGISSLLEDESLRIQVAAKGQDLVSTNYSWGSIGKRMVASYFYFSTLSETL